MKLMSIYPTLLKVISLKVDINTLIYMILDFTGDL